MVSLLGRGPAGGADRTLEERTVPWKRRPASFGEKIDLYPERTGVSPCFRSHCAAAAQHPALAVGGGEDQRVAAEGAGPVSVQGPVGSLEDRRDDGDLGVEDAAPRIRVKSTTPPRLPDPRSGQGT